jgi:phosphatidylglycerol:prolipoprotein diacylglycerol transferase
MLHTWDPFLIQISGNFGIRWYGLAYVAGFFVAYLIISWLAERQNEGLAREQVGDFIVYCAVGTLVGGRLGYALFYSPDLFFRFKLDPPFWGILAVHEGGMASHGGMIGIILACLLYSIKHGQRVLYLLDLVSVGGPIGVFFGRIANFINGELYGRPCDPQFPLAVKFPQEILNWPTQEFSRLASLKETVASLGVSSDQWDQLLAQFNTSYPARVQVNEILSGVVHATQNDQMQVINAIQNVLTTRHPSQLYAAVGEGLLTFLILFISWRKPKKPGSIAARFIVVYAIIRILDEQFRTPDVGIGFGWMGLTRGQMLSLVMLVMGIIASLVWGRSGSLPVQGWQKISGVRINRNSR